MHDASRKERKQSHDVAMSNATSNNKEHAANFKLNVLNLNMTHDVAMNNGMSNNKEHVSNLKVATSNTTSKN